MGTERCAHTIRLLNSDEQVICLLVLRPWYNQR